MSVPFKKGFNDAFHHYAVGPNPALAHQRAADIGDETTIRFPLTWLAVEPSFAGQARWSSPTHDYSYVRSRASALGMKVLPVISTCPTAWIPAAERRLCAPGVSGSFWYPYGGGVSKYTDFVLRVLDFFDEYGVIDAVEVWNEPNLTYVNPPSRSAIPDARHFSSILAATLSTVEASALYRDRITVISGGLSMSYADPELYQDYLDVFVNQCYSYGLGIHPYDTRNHQGKTWDAAADAVVARVTALYDQVEDYLLAVHGIFIQDLWVTETGASARNPFGLDGQKRALRKLAGANGTLASRGRCKAVLLHRMYPSGQDDPDTPLPDDGPEGAGTPFYKFSLLNFDTVWSVRPAYTRLAQDWT